MKKLFNIKTSIYFSFLLFIIIGFYSYDDYGMSLDEQYHRNNSYFWYTYLKSTIKDFITTVFSGAETFTYESLKTNLTSSSFYQNNDEPAFIAAPLSLFYEFLVDIFNIEREKNIFELRHLYNFFIFLVGIFFFYKLIYFRYKSYLYSLIGILFLFFTPRIFAESFYNEKDIFFLTLIIINIYIGFIFLKDPKLNNTILFSLSSALAFDTRIMAFIPITFMLIFLSFKCMRSVLFFKKNLKFIIYYFIFTLAFILIFWPYLWHNPIINLLNLLEVIDGADWSVNNFYLGEFILSSYVPWHYHIIWILVTSPIVVILFFLLGSFFVLRRGLFRLINVNDDLNDIWRGDNEMLDLFFLLLTIICIIAFIMKGVGYSGWRHLYFIYPLIIMTFLSGIYYLSIIFRTKLTINLIYLLVVFNLSYLIYWNIKNHPHQYVYFNSIYKSNFNEKFDMDYWGLSNNTSINYIIQNNNSYPIKIATKSFAALHKNLLLLSNNDKKKVDLVTPNEADFIITNYYKRMDNEFLIDESKYEKYYEILVNNISINTVYKKISSF